MNYDRLVESMAARFGARFTTGFGDVWDPGLFAPDNDWDMRVFKLHGSVDWYRLPGRSLIFQGSKEHYAFPSEPPVEVLLYPAEGKESYAEPYATLGGLDTQACQYVAAEGDFRRAIAANTNYIIGHQWYALLLSRLGRCGEAVREGRIAQQLDPLSPYAKGTLALALECSGRTAEAIDSRRTIARLFPDDANQHFHLFYLLHSLKRDDEAIRELSLGLTQSGFAPLASRVQTSFPTTGVNGAVRMYLHDPAISREDSRWSQARMHALLGDREATLTNLERSYATHGNIAFLNVTPEFEFVRDDPRFRELLLKLRLIAPAAQ